MNEYDTLALAHDLGITLSLSKDREHILAYPREKLTDKLRSAIYANRDDLIRTLLFRAAGEWIGDRSFSAPNEADEALNEAFYKDLIEFRETLRMWAKAGLANAKKGVAI